MTARDRRTTGRNRLARGPPRAVLRPASFADGARNSTSAGAAIAPRGHGGAIDESSNVIASGHRIRWLRDDTVDQRRTGHGRPDRVERRLAGGDRQWVHARL